MKCLINVLQIEDSIRFFIIMLATLSMLEWAVTVYGYSWKKLVSDLQQSMDVSRKYMDDI